MNPLLQSGLKKVFMNAGNAISYNHVESVGMGYIKDITTAKRVALQEARELAKEYGYQDNEEEAKFVKEDIHSLGPKDDNEHPESDMNNPEEKREVQIGKEILKHIDDAHKENKDSETKTMYIHLDEIARLVDELIKMHGTTNKLMSGWDTLQLGSH